MPRISYAHENRTPSRSGSRRGRSYYDEEEDYRARRTPPRDEEGRFMSEEDEAEGDYRRGASSGQRGSYSSSSRGRGHGGWFGDPEGHSRAAREGWGEEEEYRPLRSRRSRYEEDDEASYARSRPGSYYASSSRGRGHGGWFGDPEGHSEASREGWENPDHGPSGWYGDEEGHREAAERGGEHGHRGQRSGRRRRYAA